MKITTKTSFAELIQIEAGGFLLEEHTNTLMAYPLPSRLCGREIPEDLHSATLLQLSKVRDTPLGVRGLTYLIELFVGIPSAKLNKEPACKVMPVARWVLNQLERISKAFAQIKTSYSPEEVRAGVKRLNFGYYGMADSYALRMGITDPDIVMENTPWIKIFHAMKKDNELDAYQRRVREEFAKKQKK